ncbi:vacuolar protein sorting 37A [Arctopsyche grandis]|uniref:vacuolar protein sorting 37A n=1 Tax=Arctopsyche grandis TaxID=121162 RepID=UPI00406D87C7
MLARNFVTETEKRRRQIDTLKIFNDNVAEIKENAEYSVEFTSGNIQMFLEVVLGSNFPQEAPVLSVRPLIIHPWVAEDNCSIVSAPGLINYTIHSDLGRIVQAIIRELEQNPPKLLEETPPNRSEVDLNLNQQNISQNSTAHNSPSLSVASPVKVPAFPELQSLSIDELNNLTNSVDLQDKFIEKLPQTVEVDTIIQEHMDQIEQLAKENLSKQKTLDDLKKDVIERLESMSELKTNYETLQTKYEKLCTIYTSQAILAMLADSTAKADEESEHLAESFLQGELDCDTFLKNYEMKRGLGHIRRARHDRLLHQLSQLDKISI